MNTQNVTAWTPEQVALAKTAEAYETDRWVPEAVFDVEVFTRTILDPCCGRGVWGDAARIAGYDIVEQDLHNWGRGSVGIDYLAGTAGFMVPDQSVVMNPPFTLACEFVGAALSRGARKVACFQRWAWWAESRKRRAFWEQHPPTRIWACGDRATGFPITMSEQERRFLVTGERRGSSKTAHAVFVWERPFQGERTIGKIWDKSKDRVAA